MLIFSEIFVKNILVRFSLNLKFLDRFSKNTQISWFMKILSLGAELFHADGRTDMAKIFSLFAILRTPLKSLPPSLVYTKIFVTL